MQPFESIRWNIDTLRHRPASVIGFRQRENQLRKRSKDPRQYDGDMVRNAFIRVVARWAPTNQHHFSIR
jgi:hypothetical protein